MFTRIPNLFIRILRYITNFDIFKKKNSFKFSSEYLFVLDGHLKMQIKPFDHNYFNIKLIYNVLSLHYYIYNLLKRNGCWGDDK